MEKLTRIQQAYLQKVCFLLLLQLILLLIVIWLTHTFFPHKICLITCQKWIDLLLFLLLIVVLTYVSHLGQTPLIRYTAFFAISVIMAYVLALQYNIIALLSGNEKKTATTFVKAVVLVVSILAINLILLPFLMRNMSVVYSLSAMLFICLVGLILWGLFIGKAFLLWVTVSLVVFLGLLTTDLAILTHQCKKQGTVACDPIHGASMLYADLINILQQIFILLNTDQR